MLPSCGYELDREEMSYVDGGTANVSLIEIPSGLADAVRLTPVNQSLKSVAQSALLNNLTVGSVNTGMTPQCACCTITIIGIIVTMVSILKK